MVISAEFSADSELFVPDSRRSWTRLAVAVLIGSLGSVGMWSVVVALPVVQQDFGVTRGTASLARIHQLMTEQPEIQDASGLALASTSNEFVGAIEGMREACLALDYPVVSGNVSLYNETNGRAILPTPVIGGVELSPDACDAIDLALKRDGDALILIGETCGHLGCSLYLREIEGSDDAMFPFWSADNRSLGFFAHGKLKTVAESVGRIFLDEPKPGHG